MSFDRPKLRYYILSFLLGGFVCTVGEFVIRYYLPYGQHGFYEKQCPTPRENLERRGLSSDGLNIPVAHDGKPLFTFPVPSNFDDTKEVGVVIVPVAQDLDTNGDGVPDQPVVWELPFSIPFPEWHTKLPDAPPTPSATPTMDLSREIDTAFPPRRTKRGLTENAAFKKFAEVYGNGKPEAHPRYVAETIPARDAIP